MNDGAALCLLFGSIIIAFCIGIMYEAVIGWLVFGCGLLGMGLIEVSLNYLNGKNAPEEE